MITHDLIFLRSFKEIKKKIAEILTLKKIALHTSLHIEYSKKIEKFKSINK